MKKIIISTLILSTFLLSGCDVANKPIDFKNLSSKQQTDLGNYIQDYLIKNPELLIKMNDQLQKKVSDSQLLNIVKLKERLLSDTTPHISSKDAKVAVIEFFDYNCIYCSKIAPEFEKTISNNKDVNFYFKETPIFSGQYKTSIISALAGEYVFKTKGIEAYLNYHNSIYATGHNEGALTIEDINNVLKNVGSEQIAKDITPEMVNEGKEPLVSKDNINLVKDNMDLSKLAGLQGTPYIIVMPINNPTAENIRIIQGYENSEKLNSVIEEVKKTAE